MSNDYGIFSNPCQRLQILQRLVYLFISKSGSEKWPWTSFMLVLHTKLSLISRGVLGLACYSPCGVWGHGWTACFLYGSPFLGLCINWCVSLTRWRWVFFFWFPTYIDVFIRYLSFAYYSFFSNGFNSEITIYAKFFVLSYSIDVVSALS